MASKTTQARTSTTNKEEESSKVNAETGVLDKDEVKARFVEKCRRGDFTFPEDMVRGLAHALGVEDEFDDSFFGRSEGPSSTAGLTPATGSGGVPYTKDAASEETEKYAGERQKAVDKDENVTPRDRRLVEQQFAK